MLEQLALCAETHIEELEVIDFDGATVVYCPSGEMKQSRVCNRERQRICLKERLEADFSQGYLFDHENPSRRHGPALIQGNPAAHDAIHDP